MTTPTPDASPTRPWRPLDPIQRRVLGVLIEKAKTTPAGYPMTVNAIVTACNQKSNRDPLMALDDFSVEKALSELRDMGAVSEVDWVGRVSKFKHLAYEWLGADKPEIAVMTELLLRGAQSLGDLRGRAARMEPIPDLAALKPIVDALVARGLMIELTPPGRGQIVSHNLHLEGERAELAARYAGSARGADVLGAAAATPRGGSEEARGGGVTLTAEVASLREEVARLRERLDALEARLASRG
jgi:uncharacterized protein YceH (UPF0502 family)